MTRAATPAAKAMNSLFLARIPAAFDGKAEMVSVEEAAAVELNEELRVTGGAVVLRVVLV